MRKLSGVFTGVIVFLALFIGFASAQNTAIPYAPVYDSDTVGGSRSTLGPIKWLPDSSGLIIYRQTLYDPPETLLYLLDTQRTDPYQDTLTPAIMQTLAALKAPPVATQDGRTAPLYISPDQKFVIYPAATQTRTAGFYDLNLVDLTTGKQKVISGINGSSAFAPDIGYPGNHFTVSWNQNSTALYFGGKRIPEHDSYYYVTNFTHSLDALTMRPFGASFVSHGLTAPEGHINESILDIDHTGEFLLTGAMDLLDMKTLSYTDIASHPGPGFISLGSIAFTGPDDMTVNYIGVNGIYAYDRKTGENRLKNDAIPTANLREIAFSPDGRYIAFITRGQQSLLYVVEIEPIPSPTATP